MKKTLLTHLFTRVDTQSHRETKCSSFVMQMAAAAASGMLSSSWLCWHFGAGLSISHSVSDSLIWNLDEVEESCWSSIFMQRLIWKTKVGDLIRPTYCRGDNVRYTNDTLNNTKTVINYNKCAWSHVIVQTDACWWLMLLCFRWWQAY